MSKSRLIYKPCRRCGQTIATLDRPIFASKSIYNQYAGICGDCFTPEEHKGLQQAYNDLFMGKRKEYLNK